MGDKTYMVIAKAKEPYYIDLQGLRKMLMAGKGVVLDFDEVNTSHVVFTVKNLEANTREIEKEFSCKVDVYVHE